MAANGNNGTTYRPAYGNEINANCFHSADFDMEAHWKVILGRHYTITKIKIFGRLNCKHYIHVLLFIKL